MQKGQGKTQLGAVGKDSSNKKNFDSHESKLEIFP